VFTITEMRRISDSSITTDAAGNLQSHARGGWTQSFTWNAQNRLYTISNYNPVESFTLAYDAFGRRVHQQITGGSNPTQIVYVGADFEYDTTPQQANLYFFVSGQRIASFASFGNYYAGDGWTVWDDFGRRLGPPLGGLVLVVGFAGVVVLVTRRRPAWLAGLGAGFLGGGILLVPIPASTGGGGGGSVHGSHGEQTGVYYLPDHLGSTRAVVNHYGDLLETRDYDPWGNSIAHGPGTPSFHLKHRFMIRLR
jgi:YD repeat-containing protein